MFDVMKKYKTVIITIAVSLVVLLTIVFMLHKDVSLIPIDNSLPTQEFNPVEGLYKISINYSSSQDSYLEWYYTAMGQEYTLWQMVLPTSIEQSQLVVSVNMPFTLRNGSLQMRILGEGSDCSITNVNISSASWNKKGLLSIAIYMVVAFAAAVLLVKDSREQVMTVAFCSALTLFLEPLFLVSVSTQFLWLVISIAILLLLRCKKISISNDVKLFGMFLLFALLLTEFFTTSSPLYPVNTGNDSSIYYSIGSAIANGRKLYSEVFDHKGPVLFWFFAIGYLLSPFYYYGVWLFEAVALALDMYFTYKIASRFSRRRLSILAALIMPIILLNDNYLITGSTMEIFAVPLILGAFVLLLPYMTINESHIDTAHGNTLENTADHRYSSRNMFIVMLILGLLASIVFWSKFSICFAWIIMAFLFWVCNIKYAPIKSAIGYICGWCITTIPVCVYFAVNGGVKQIYHYYFVFNAQYGGIDSISDAIARDIGNIYNAFIDNEAVSLLILFGIVFFVVIMKNVNLCGRTILIVSFVILCGTAYAGQNTYPYYFTLIASYAVWGIVAIMSVIEVFFMSGSGIREKVTSVLHSGDSILSSTCAIDRLAIGVALLTFGCTFFVNSFVTESILIDKEPRMQEVMAQQMELYAVDGDKSFFNLGCLDRSCFAASKQYPTTQYFFFPNVLIEDQPEPYAAQISYLSDRTTQYFIWRGFNEEHYPDAGVATENYEHVTTYRMRDDNFYMLFKRKQ